jgi:hypothetical protein
MNVTKISTADVSPYQPMILKKAENNEKIEKKDDSNINSSNKTNWQKNILLSALDNLEDKIQTANNHPLGRISNSPIETNEEALIELSFLNTPIYREQASKAQANIVAEDVFALFADAPELFS